LQRTRDPGDERQVRVVLTDQGRARRTAASSDPGCVLGTTCLTRPDMQRLLDQVSALRDALVSHATGSAKSLPA
jgi:DNA-binding MarR family transcriptional regulator